MASVTYLSRRQTRAIWPRSESDELLHLAIEVVGFGIFDNDLKRKRTRFSPELCAILGLPVGTEMPNEEACGLVDERDRAAFEAAANADTSSPNKCKWSVVCRVLRADNAVRWILVRGRLIYRRTANGVQPVRSMGVVLDVTHLKEAEEALRQSEARLRIAASGAALGIFEWNPATDQAVWHNDRMYEIFGHTREDGTLSQQQFVERYLHLDHAADYRAALNEAIRVEGNFHAVCRICGKTGLQRWIEIHGKFQRTASDGPLRLVGVVADITAPKELEKEAKELSERLVTLQEEERQRIAQELHDTTAQHLVAANLNLTHLRSKSGLERDHLELLDLVEGSLDKASKELRTFTYLIHPPALEGRGFVAAIGQYIDGYADRSQLEVKFRSNPKVDKLPFRMLRPLFRMVQEALANVHRHAAASHISVDLRLNANRLNLTITDNGRGIIGTAQNGQAALSQPGLGISGIRARVRQLDGDLKIRTGPHGTSIHVVLPV